MKRFASIWFPYLITDWYSSKNRQLYTIPFVTCIASHGRLIVSSVNKVARKSGITAGMSLADAKAIAPQLIKENDVDGLQEKLLRKVAEWCIRFTPVSYVDQPDGILLDVTGCTHLWNGEENYIKVIHSKLRQKGYTAIISIADTIGAAWALARYSAKRISSVANHITDVLSLPVESLRIDAEVSEKLHKLGLHVISNLIPITYASIKRRFGPQLVKRLKHVTGAEEEFIQPVIPVSPFEERLPCMDAIYHAAGIETAIKNLVQKICSKCIAEEKAIRKAVVTCYRIDGTMCSIAIHTSKLSRNAEHIFHLFSLKIETIDPQPGIDLFILTVSHFQNYSAEQEEFWKSPAGLQNKLLAECLDRISTKTSEQIISRYLPAAHYWPEKSFRKSTSLDEKADVEWLKKRRPLLLLHAPENISVTAPVPDYPPMLFRHKNKIHKIMKADGPERIEQEWWLTEGEHRDYYIVEDEDGCRYWIFRSGHYDTEKKYQWFLHGYFG